MIFVCGYLSLSGGQESLWNGVGPYEGCLHATRLVALLWMGSRHEHIAGGESTDKGRRSSGCMLLATFARVSV